MTILSRLHGRNVAPDEVRKLCKRDVLDVAEMVRYGRKLGLRVRGITIDWTALSGGGVRRRRMGNLGPVPTATDKPVGTIIAFPGPIAVAMAEKFNPAV